MNSRISVRGNVIASFFGRFWASLLNLAFTPIYIKLLGVEVYGLIGVFMSLIAFLSLLDMGISATLSRELPRLYGKDDVREARDLVCTFERIYWTIGFIIFVLLALLAAPISNYWVKSSVLPTEQIESVLIIMGASIALQWPSGLYSGGMMGLQRHVQLNIFRSIMMLLQHAGTVFLLMWVSPSIMVFFCWQAVVGLLTTVVLGIGLWRALPTSCSRACFSRELLVKHWRFATGMTGISITSILLTQTDKVILSKLLTLEEFGYYILAFNIGNVLVSLVNPIFISLFPRLSQLVALDDQKSVSDLYHKGCQLAALVVLPVASTLVFFSQQVLELWIQDHVVVENTHILLVLIVIGTSINALMTLPYALMLAYGWTRLVNMQNLLSTIIFIPAQFLISIHYGAEGVAFLWIALNVGYLLLRIPLMHRRLLMSEMRSWYLFDFIQPVAASVVIAIIFRIAEPAGLDVYARSSWVILAGLCSIGVLVLLMPATRYIFLKHVSSWS